MIKIYIFIFSIIPFWLTASPRLEKRQFEKNIQELQKIKDFRNLIIALEAYIEKYPYEKQKSIELAEALLRQDFSVPTKEDDIFTRHEKWQKAEEVYGRASLLFGKALPDWSELDPKESRLGYWYFQWGLCEHLLGRKEKAITIYLQALRKPKYPTETLYNIAILKEELGLQKEADFYFKKFYDKANQLK